MSVGKDDHTTLLSALHILCHTCNPPLWLCFVVPSCVVGEGRGGLGVEGVLMMYKRHCCGVCPRVANGLSCVEIQVNDCHQPGVRLLMVDLDSLLLTTLTPRQGIRSHTCMQGCCLPPKHQSTFKHPFTLAPLLLRYTSLLSFLIMAAVSASASASSASGSGKAAAPRRDGKSVARR